jgi:hypothetical protein
MLFGTPKKVIVEAEEGNVPIDHRKSSGSPSGLSISAMEGVFSDTERTLTFSSERENFASTDTMECRGTYLSDLCCNNEQYYRNRRQSIGQRKGMSDLVLLISKNYMQRKNAVDWIEDRPARRPKKIFP